MKLSRHPVPLMLTLAIGAIFLFTCSLNVLRFAGAQIASDGSSPVVLLNQSVMVTNGQMHILGQIKNVENKPLNYVKVLVSFYDQSNKFLGSEFNYAAPSTVGPNAVSTFDIPITSSNVGGKIYTLTVAWQNPDGSSGYSIMKPQTKRPSTISKSIPSNPILPQAGKDTLKSIPSNPTPPQSRVQALANQQPSRYPLKLTYLGTVGSEGSTSGKFFNPSSIEYSSSDNRIYVSDLNNDRIQIFDIKGHFISTLGASGTGDGQFTHPGDVAVDHITGDIYVSDIGNNRIQKFDSIGNFLMKWGSAGTGNGQFNHPGDIAIDDGHFLYVTDIHNNRVQKFDSNGKFLMKWGSAGTGNGQFKFLTGITIDPSDSIYVSDTDNNRIQKFNSDGQFITKWGTSGASVSQLNRPDGITYDSQSGLLFVSDRKNARVLVFTEEGKPFSQLDMSKLTHGLKIKPRDVAIDDAGKLFVVDKASSKIHVFNTKASLQ